MNGEHHASSLTRRYDALAALSLAAKRDMRRATLFLCKMPLLAALASVLCAARTASSVVALVVEIALSACLIMVLTRERYALLRSAFFALVRMRFLAERVLAKAIILRYNTNVFFLYRPAIIPENAAVCNVYRCS
jgi:hypothetical protein